LYRENFNQYKATNLQIAADVDEGEQVDETKLLNRDELYHAMGLELGFMLFKGKGISMSKFLTKFQQSGEFFGEDFKNIAPMSQRRYFFICRYINLGKGAYGRKIICNY
jgi:hypothetical protein